jgi:hypothetical protein
MIHRYEPTPKEVEEALLAWLTDIKGIDINTTDEIQVHWRTGNEDWGDQPVALRVSWDDGGQ